MAVKTIEEAKILTGRWLRSRGLIPPYPTLGKEAIREDLNFIYEGKTEIGVNFAVIQPKKLKRTMVATSRIGLADEHNKALASMNPNDLDDFMWEMRKELLLAPATFLFIPHKGIPKSIQLSEEISFDELTEGRLSDAIDNIIRSTLLLIRVLAILTKNVERRRGRP